MADLADLSDDGLRKLLSATNTPKYLSDGELKAALQPPTPDTNLGGTLQFGPFDTGVKIPASVEAGLVSAGKSFTRLGQGAQQLYNSATGNSGGNAALANTVGQDNAAVAPLEAEHPVASFFGGAAPALATGNPLALAALGGLSYGSPTERAINAAGGYVGGKAGQMLGSGISRLFGPASQAADQGVGKGAQEFFSYPNANPWNIPLTVGQATGNRPAQIAESVAENMPFTAGTMAAARDRTYSAFNRAVSNTFGADSTKLTPDVLGAAKNKAGQTIGAIAQRNELTPDRTFAQSLADISNRAAGELTNEDSALVNKRIDYLLGKIDPQTGTIPGTIYKASDSVLGKMMKGNQGTVVDVLGDLRSATRDAMDRSISPQDATAWAQARHDYFNVKQVANAIKADPTGAALSPTQLLTQVNLAQRNARFGAGNDLAQLAQWAKPILTKPIGESGTAPRAMYQRIISNPLSSLGAAGGAVYGADKMGIGPTKIAEGALIPMLFARGLAGKPLSAASQAALRRAGGLLGYGTANALEAGQ